MAFPFWAAGTECTAQVVQISHDPSFPVSLTGQAWELEGVLESSQAWLPPFREKQRRDVTPLDSYSKCSYIFDSLGL